MQSKTLEARNQKYSNSFGAQAWHRWHDNTCSTKHGTISRCQPRPSHSAIWRDLPASWLGLLNASKRIRNQLARFIGRGNRAHLVPPPTQEEPRLVTASFREKRHRNGWMAKQMWSVWLVSNKLTVFPAELQLSWHMKCGTMGTAPWKRPTWFAGVRMHFKKLPPAICWRSNIPKAEDIPSKRFLEARITLAQ